MGSCGAPYAYPAVQPCHTGPYYAAAPPASYGYPCHSHSDRIFRCLLTLGVLLGVLAGICLVVVWFIFHHKSVEFSVTAASVSGFALTGQQLTATFDVTFSILNPNKHYRASFDHLGSSVTYQYNTLAETLLPPIDQNTEETRPMQAKMASAGGFIGDVAARQLASDRAAGAANFDLLVRGLATFKANWWIPKSRLLKVTCEGVRLGFSNATTGVGNLVGPPNKCRVDSS